MRRSNARVTVDPDLKNEKMDKSSSSMKLQFRANQPLRSTNLFSRNPKQTPRSNCFFVGLLTLVLGLFCYLFLTAFTRNNGGSSSVIVKNKFRIVIDGGSTGTRVHVFEYSVSNGNTPVFNFGEKGLASMRVNPGLSAFAEDTEAAGESLMELVEFGRKRVPEEQWGTTEVRLMATAGLRLLNSGLQDRILESCRKVLKVSGFKFQDDWASVISGSDEGMYAWVVANYAFGTLGGDPRETTGIIELGGASAQVTFIASEPIPSEFSQLVKYGNLTYSLYSHSLLQFGQNVAFDLMRESFVSRYKKLESIASGKPVDPCMPKGYEYTTILERVSPSASVKTNDYLSAFYPSGNFSECRSASLMLLQKGKEKCPYEQCHIGSTFIPKLRGKFLATENFFHTSKFFGLRPKAFLSELMVAGQQFCEEDWSKLKDKYSLLEEDDLHRYCFSSAYIVALLHDSLGIALDDERIRYANQVNDIPLDWALGAFIMQTVADVDFEHSYSIISLLGEDSSTLLTILAFLLLIFTAYSVSKWRKPQVKTIYDLEKGKYIITRVGRYP